jgi:hypothetical protein
LEDSDHETRKGLKMTTFTPEEIEQRKAASLTKHSEGKRIAQELRLEDKAIAQKMHENRKNILFTSPIFGVTLATIRQDFVYVFWTIKHQKDRDSFKLAKRYLGRYIESGDRKHHFFLEVREPVDAYTLEYLVNQNFMLKVISGEIKVPKYLKDQISKKVMKENY